MKKMTKIYACLLGGMFLGAGCENYLKEDSGDLMIPERVEEYAPMLYREGYPMGFNEEVACLYLMTDDIEMGQLELDPSDDANDSRNEDAVDAMHAGEGREAYLWEERFEEYMDRFWDSRYKNILACNVVIDALPKMVYVELDSMKYHFLASQAYALRAYHYWCLVNTYALPWSEANLDKPGVVVRKEPQIDIAPRSRSTIGEVYRLINEDIAEAERHGNRAAFDGNIHRLSPTAVLLLASRIALFQENWDEVIRTGELFLEQNSTVLDLNAQDASKFGLESDTKGFSMMNGAINKEVVFTFGRNSSIWHYDYISNSGVMYGLGFRVSHDSEESLLASYEVGDLRRDAWFMKDTPAEEFWGEIIPGEPKYAYPVKYRGVTNSGSEKPSEKLLRENWRSVEVMLNLAEAYTRKGNGVTTEALNLLNRLRSCRLSKEVYAEKTPADFKDAAELVRFIWQERRRELCFEEAMRFWDLRRQGMPELKHRWYSSWDSYKIYTLPAGSPNYVLAIPDSELHYNGRCVDNARVLILPE